MTLDAHDMHDEAILESIEVEYRNEEMKMMLFWKSELKVNVDTIT